MTDEAFLASVLFYHFSEIQPFYDEAPFIELYHKMLSILKTVNGTPGMFEVNASTSTPSKKRKKSRKQKKASDGAVRGDGVEHGAGDEDGAGDSDGVPVDDSDANGDGDEDGAGDGAGKPADDGNVDGAGEGVADGEGDGVPVDDDGAPVEPEPAFEWIQKANSPHQTRSRRRTKAIGLTATKKKGGSKKK